MPSLIFWLHSKAEAGDIIFILGGTELDLTGHTDIRVPGGVTIASDRGRSGSDGALQRPTNTTRAHSSAPRATMYDLPD